MSDPLMRTARPPVNERVREAQAYLKKVGYNLQADGRFGWFTERSVSDFQIKNDITPTGQIDDFTWTKLVATAQMPSTPLTTLSALQPPEPTAVRLPIDGFTTIGDSIVVGVDAQYRKNPAFKRNDYHYRKTGVQPEMVGKGTKYIQQHLKSEVIPNAPRQGIKTVVIGGGTNDFLYGVKNDADAERLFSEVTTRIAQNVALARAAGLRVISLGLPPEGQFIAKFDLEVRDRVNKLWDRINTFILMQASDADGPNAVIDMAQIIGQTKDGVTSYTDEYRSKADPLHPMPSGARAVARAIEDTLIALED